MTCPTLVLASDADPIFAPDQIKQATDALPNAELAWIPNCGHSPYFEQPDE